MGEKVSSDATTLTQSQNARLTRMLAVTAQLALEGGWDAVQMREVAQRAEVALGTLYRYFPSKEYLLVSVMIADIEGLADRLAVRPAEGTDPVQRVIDVLRRSNRALQRQPQITIAMIRALVSGNQEIAPAVAETRVLMRRIISDALGPEGMANGEDPERELMRIDLLSDVWLAALVSWISGVEPDTSVMPKLERASQLLLT
ncbi:transcriptional regulator, TetR family [Actinobacteria bacterium IMCC26207]|nr:transcriptional regulator, TetR family [Actinobacteria bacterium IMCC26207]